jgi:hypothetical protein
MLRPRQLRGEQTLDGSLFVSHNVTIHGRDNHYTGCPQFTQQGTNLLQRFGSSLRAFGVSLVVLGLLVCTIEVRATDPGSGGVRETTRVFLAYSTLSKEVNMLSVHAIMKCGIFIALPLLSSMLEADYQCRAVASQPQQNSEILSQIDSGLISHINRVKTFRQVTFEAITNSGCTEIEVSSKDDNFAIVIRPISAEGHYTSNVYGSNEDYGFWLGNPAEGTGTWVIRSVSDYQNKALQDHSSYSYGNLLKTLADSGMISLSSFRPFSYLQFS